MCIEEARLFTLNIPFRIGFSHAKANRTFSDSLVVMLRSRDGRGFGEAVVREYVTGALGGTEGEVRARCTSIVRGLLAPLREGDPTAERLLGALESISCGKEELPLLCAVETAVLDLLCRREEKDIFALLGREPVRSMIHYGGILPFASPELAGQILALYHRLGLTAVRVKLGSDPAYNRAILKTARGALGRQFDIRVDVNGAWSENAFEEQLAVCAEQGVRMIEQPFDGQWKDHAETLRRATEKGFTFAADESAVTEEDLLALRPSHCFMVNLRLSKNGGLLRTLKLAAKAEELGLKYQLGCHVGETGILSGLGRAAAALLPDPLYVDGSYDELLLSENITRENFGFGRMGGAPVIRSKGIGFSVDIERLERLSISADDCL